MCRTETDVLVRALDHVEWDPRSLEEIEGFARRPLWVRIANFFTRSLELLRVLEPPRLVVWKLEFWGTDTPYDRFPASPGVDPAAYARELLDLGHHVVPYTYTEWNRRHLLAEVQALAQNHVHVLPVAQKPPVAVAPGAARRRFGIAGVDVVLGAGGLLHPAKGIEEIVDTFLCSSRDPRTHLLCSVVPDDTGETTEDIRHTWERAYGTGGMERLHVRAGSYGEWPWMCAFYQALDVMLVNSVSDSWGRMVSEAVGFGVPVLVRRAGCATNYVVPGLTLVEGFGDLGTPAFGAAVRMAKTRAPQLAAYVRQHYSLPRVRRMWLDLLRAETPPVLRPRFDHLAEDAASRACLDDMIVF